MRRGFPPLDPQAGVTICRNVSQWEVPIMGFRMTASDREVLRWVAECRLVTTPQLAALLARNAKSLTQRISQLVTEGLLAEVPRGPGQHRGRPERVISLTERGVQSLRERGTIDATIPTEAIVSDAVPPHAHQLLLNWVRVHLHHVQTVVAHLKIEFLAHNSPFLPPGFSNISVSGPARGGQEPRRGICLKPDAAFSICDASQGKTVLFFLEVDRGTETLASLKRGPGDIRQKILNYGMCFDAGDYKKYESLWDCKLKGFRLLFITDNVARLSALCTLVQEMPPSDYIWLTTADRMFTDGISAEIWVRGGRLEAPPRSILGQFRCRAPLP
jgi:hypothetical protein